MGKSAGKIIGQVRELVPVQVRMFVEPLQPQTCADHCVYNVAYWYECNKTRLFALKLSKTRQGYSNIDMSKSLIFNKTIYYASGWDDALWQRAVIYWQERGFKFTERHGGMQSGKRGSFWGNLTSYDMSKLRATMTITRVDLTNVGFVMEVNTAMQEITEWNAAYWKMEMETLETWLFEGDDQKEEWQAFDKKWRKAAWNWTITLGLGGNKMPPKR